MNWKIIWAMVATATVIIASVIANSPAIVTLTSVVGVSFVLGVAYNWKYTNILGVCTTVLFAYLSYQAGYLANAFINLFLLTPLQVLAHFIWTQPDKLARIQRMRPQVVKDATKGMMYVCIPLAIIGWFIALTWGGNLWFHDGLSAALVISATLLLMLRAKEQWLFWIPYNFLEVIMWFFAASLAPEVLAIAAMRMVFFLNSLIGYYNWNKR